MAAAVFSTAAPAVLEEECSMCCALFAGTVPPANHQNLYLRAQRESASRTGSGMSPLALGSISRKMNRRKRGNAEKNHS